MKINIVKNERIESDQVVVSFSSEFGNGKARWNGESPLEGREYYVELEIPDTAEWRKDVIKSDKEQYCIKSNGKCTSIVCVVESFFDYGCCDFRIGTSLVTLTIAGEHYPKGTFVEISTENLILYDTNV